MVELRSLGGEVAGKVKKSLREMVAKEYLVTDLVKSYEQMGDKNHTDNQAAIKSISDIGRDLKTEIDRLTRDLTKQVQTQDGENRAKLTEVRNVHKELCKETSDWLNNANNLLRGPDASLIRQHTEKIRNGVGLMTRRESEFNPAQIQLTTETGAAVPTLPLSLEVHWTSGIQHITLFAQETICIPTNCCCHTVTHLSDGSLVHGGSDNRFLAQYKDPASTYSISGLSFQPKIHGEVVALRHACNPNDIVTLPDGTHVFCSEPNEAVINITSMSENSYPTVIWTRENFGPVTESTAYAHRSVKDGPHTMAVDKKRKLIVVACGDNVIHGVTFKGELVKKFSLADCPSIQYMSVHDETLVIAAGSSGVLIYQLD